MFKLTLSIFFITIVVAMANNKPDSAGQPVVLNLYQSLPTPPPFRLPTLPSLPSLPSLPTLRLPSMPTLPPFRFPALPTLPQTFRVPVRAQVVSRPAAVTLPPLRVPEKIVVQRVELPRPTVGPISSPIKIEYQDVPYQGPFNRLPPLGQI